MSPTNIERKRLRYLQPLTIICFKTSTGISSRHIFTSKVGFFHKILLCWSKELFMYIENQMYLVLTTKSDPKSTYQSQNWQFSFCYVDQLFSVGTKCKETQILYLFCPQKYVWTLNAVRTCDLFLFLKRLLNFELHSDEIGQNYPKMSLKKVVDTLHK